ncbi:MAG: RlmE family RNA methyltransferase [Candidatus Dadabacteria bacterium]|nr:MAG: RlmE family RNA methyltransferase [Candidatus Dadabacteria bacterium]
MAKSYNRKDHYYEKAKAVGYRSRAAYKLLELQKKYSIIKTGQRVLDLGCWPGGWLQVSKKLVGNSGYVAGIDLKQIDQLSSTVIRFYCGDVSDEALLKQTVTDAGSLFDVVLSDMAPKLTGIKEADRAAVEGIAEIAFWAAEKTLKPGGNFVVKVFKSNEINEFYRNIHTRFDKCLRKELSSSRKTSNEFYLIGLGFKK